MLLLHLFCTRGYEGLFKPLIGRGSEYPVNLKTFLLTFTAINPSYNGAWWFLTIYIILVLLSTYINKIVIKYNTVVITGLSLIIYFTGYIQRMMVPIVTSSEVIIIYLDKLHYLEHHNYHL